MQRILLVTLLASLTAACSGANNGAVVVRWRLIDASTGDRASGCSVSSALAQATVDQVELMVQDSNNNFISCPSCLFSCGPMEGTTAFALPAATYGFNLRAIRCNATIGFTPPTVMRVVEAGQITNLGAIEILIPAGTVENCGLPNDAG